MTKMFHNAAPNMTSSVLRKTNIYFRLTTPRRGKPDTLILEMRKNKIWDSLFKWMQSCQLSLGEHNYLHINTALGLMPYRSKHKLQINFCCLIAKHHNIIWLCCSKEHPPNLNNFLLYNVFETYLSNRI